jgi:hypothetical protein
VITTSQSRGSGPGRQPLDQRSQLLHRLRHADRHVAQGEDGGGWIPARRVGAPDRDPRLRGERQQQVRRDPLSVRGLGVVAGSEDDADVVLARVDPANLTGSAESRGLTENAGRSVSGIR